MRVNQTLNCVTSNRPLQVEQWMFGRRRSRRLPLHVIAVRGFSLSLPHRRSSHLPGLSLPDYFVGPFGDFAGGCPSWSNGTCFLIASNCSSCILFFSLRSRIVAA